MPFKTITIKESAYRRLSRARRPGESFTDVIDRLATPPSPLDLSGILSAKAGARLRRAVRAHRAQWERETGRRIRRMT